MITVRDFYEYLNELAPFNTQEEWDNSGLLVGDMNAEVTKAIVVLDVTMQTVKSAAELGANLIISHHPVIFSGMKNFLKGNVAFELAANSINVICSHTPLDIAESGTNDTLAGLLGLNAYVKGTPLLRFAEIPKTDAVSLARRVSEALGATVRFADGGRPIEKLAVCAGAGCSLIDEAGDIDAFITGDAGHHDFSDAVNCGITLIAAGHYETENPVVGVLAEKLSRRFPGAEIIDIKQPSIISYI